MQKKARHTREAPPEWAGLLAYAEKVVPSKAENAGVWSFFRLSRRVSRLTDRDLFFNYYYGMGEVMTVMSDLLQVKETRAQVINDTARLMVRGALQERLPYIEVNEPFMPVVHDLNPSKLMGPFITLAEQAMPRVRAPERSLINALDYVSDYRRAISINDIGAKLIAAHLFEGSRRGLSVAEHIGMNALTGATKVIVNQVLV